MGHHFVLIHGGSHGAWAWSKTVDRLQKAGCKGTALDLASAGNDSTDPNTITSMAEYSKPAVDFLASLPDDEKVVLIAHCMGGYTNLELMERFPQKIALAIFVSASVTPSGVALLDSPLGDMMFKDTVLGESCLPAFANGADKPPTSMMFADKYLAEVFYTGCSPEDIELASTLVKGFPVQAMGTPVTYTKERHGQVPSVYVKNLRDNTLLLPTQNYIVENYGPFTEVVEVDAGHFSSWSHADEFAKLVLLFADKYDIRQQT